VNISAEIIGLLLLALGALAMWLFRIARSSVVDLRRRTSSLESRVSVLEARGERGHDDGK